MSSIIEDLFKNLVNNPDFDLSVDEIRKKYGDSVLKTKGEINKITNRFYEIFNQKPKLKCFHPNSKECSGKPIKSHSIQKSLISVLADSTKHVLMFKTDFTPYQRPKASIEKIGINKATIYPGLCSKHDFETFKPIENNPIDISNKEHIFLFSYRALLRLYFVKNHFYEVSKKIVDLFSKEQNKDQLFSIILMNAYSHYLGMFHLNKIKLLFDDSLLTRKFDVFLDYGVRVINKFIPISVCSAFTPIYDINGSILNDFNFKNYKETPRYVFLNIVSIKPETYLFYSTLKNQTKELKGFVEPLEKIKIEKLYDYLSEIILKYTENFIMSPDYWESFSEKKKEAIIKFYNDAVFNINIKYNSMLHNIFNE